MRACAQKAQSEVAKSKERLRKVGLLAIVMNFVTERGDRPRG